MDTNEHEAWMAFMRSRRGLWTIDPIHNGRGAARLLAFCPAEGDASKGVYIELNRDGACHAGDYSEAIPHIGDACFQPRWRHTFASYANGLEAVMGRIGARS
jgi:hypothetical protein